MRGNQLGCPRVHPKAIASAEGWDRAMENRLGSEWGSGMGKMKAFDLARPLGEELVPKYLVSALGWKSVVM